MKTIVTEIARPEVRNGAGAIEAAHDGLGSVEARHEWWAHCHVNWTAVWIGALATFSMVIMFGLVGTALGAYLIGPEHRVVDMRKLGLWTLVFSVCAAFFSSVIGGWVAVKIAGILHAEPAMLHGAFAWLMLVPMLVVCSTLGASSLSGGWYGGIGARSAANANPYIQPEPLAASSTPEEITAFQQQRAEYNHNVKQWHEDTPRAIRNGALIAVTALLLGLLGSVIGGWYASGEPMNFAYYRTRTPVYRTV
jgi:hypothetical protein